MSAYSAVEHENDKERILTALDDINKLREEYKDVLAIPEVITLHDISEYHIDTATGPKQVKTIYSRDVIANVLQYFAGTDYVTPEQFEHTIVCALSDIAKQRKK